MAVTDSRVRLRPDIEALELRRAGINLKPGRPDLVLGANLRTTNLQVYALGDAAGSVSHTFARSAC